MSYDDGKESVRLEVQVNSLMPRSMKVFVFSVYDGDECNEEAVLPYSQITSARDPRKLELGERTTMEIPKWLARDRNLVED